MSHPSQRPASGFQKDFAAVPSILPVIRRDLDRLLEGATFLDSSVLSELILAQQRVDGDPGQELAIVSPRDGVAARLIDLVDAGRMFSMFETRAEALQSIGRTPGGGESGR